MPAEEVGDGQLKGALVPLPREGRGVHGREGIHELCAPALQLPGAPVDVGHEAGSVERDIESEGVVLVETAIHRVILAGVIFEVAVFVKGGRGVYAAGRGGLAACEVLKLSGGVRGICARQRALPLAVEGKKNRHVAVYGVPRLVCRKICGERLRGELGHEHDYVALPCLLHGDIEHHFCAQRAVEPEVAHGVVQPALGEQLLGERRVDAEGDVGIARDYQPFALGGGKFIIHGGKGAVPRLRELRRQAYARQKNGQKGRRNAHYGRDDGQNGL